jgi:hypothetical protein
MSFVKSTHSRVEQKKNPETIIIAGNLNDVVPLGRDNSDGVGGGQVGLVGGTRTRTHAHSLRPRSPASTADTSTPGGGGGEEEQVRRMTSKKTDEKGGERERERNETVLFYNVSIR